MGIVTLSTIAIASAINSAMPGPCVALTIGRSARDGLNAGLSVTLGVVLANLVLACVTLSIMLGMLAMSESAFIAMKLAGVTALIVLALRVLSKRGERKERRQITGGDQARDLGAGLERLGCRVRITWSFS